MFKKFSLLVCLLPLSLSPIGFARSQDQGHVIPAGTEIQLSLRDTVSSKLSEPGDEVIATVRRSVVADGFTLLKEGTEVIGRVTLAEPAGRVFKGGRLHITFDRIRVDGQEQKLTAVIKSASDFTRDEKIKSDSEGTMKGGKDGGKALNNAMMASGLGMMGATIAILAGSPSQGGAIAGASILGGSAVTGVLMTKGKEVRLDQNTIVRLKLERPIRLE